MLGTRLLLLSCVIIWGWTFVATRICLEYINQYELIGIRLLIGLPILLGIILAKKIRWTFGHKDLKYIIAGSSIIIAHFLIQATALKYTTATNTGWIISMTPLITAVLAYLFLKERLGKGEIAGIIISTFGVLLLVSKGDFVNLDWLQSKGDWMILISVFTWAIYTITTRDLSRQHHPLIVTLVVFSPLLIVCLTYMLGTSAMTSFTSLPVKPIIALLFLGTLGTVAQWFWQEGVARLGAAKAGIFLYLEPVATTVLAVPLIADERFGFFTAIGGLLVLFGVWWASRTATK
ncbi:MAG: DMT family transporter [candidate division Zixibacteria bacterium]|nr:DMT family transporter [candidate division Zixibacteria bacterium]